MPNTINCLYCGNLGARAREHVFPLWLLRALSAGDEVIAFRHRSVTGGVLSERTHTLNRFTFGHVCAICNNGWLSELETEGQRVFAKIWRGRRLEPIDRYGLALWCLKTACVLNAASNYRAIIDTSHADAVRRMHPPVGLFVHMARRTTPFKVSWEQSRTLTFVGEKEDIDDAARAFGNNGFKVLFGFGSLLFRNVYLPAERFVVGPLESVGGPRQSQIWPLAEPFGVARHKYASLEDFADDAVACLGTA